MKMKMSNRDKNLLLIVLGILIIVLVYLYVFNSFNEKTQTLQSQNVILQQQNQLLLQLASSSEEYQKDIENYNTDSSNLIDRYPVFLQEEDENDYINSLETSIPDTYVSYIATPKAEAVALTVPSREDLLVSSQDVTGAITANQYVDTEGTYIDVNALTLYASSASVSFLCSYDGLKEILNNIAAADAPKAIDNISVAYDEGYGLLNVSMTLNFYYMNGLDKTYKAPDSGINSHHVDNVFGTAETLGRVNTTKSSKSSEAASKGK